MNQRLREVERSRILATYLTQAINEFKPVVDPPRMKMTKLAELSALIKTTKQLSDTAITKVMDRAAAANASAEVVIAKAHAHIDNVVKDVAELEQSLIGEGHNNPPGEQ